MPKWLCWLWEEMAFVATSKFMPVQQCVILSTTLWGRYCSFWGHEESFPAETIVGLLWYPGSSNIDCLLYLLKLSHHVHVVKGVRKAWQQGYCLLTKLCPDIVPNERQHIHISAILLSLPHNEYLGIQIYFMCEQNVLILVLVADLSLIYPCNLSSRNVDLRLTQNALCSSPLWSECTCARTRYIQTWRHFYRL